MRLIFLFLSIVFFLNCSSMNNNGKKVSKELISQKMNEIKNEKIKSYSFLKGMYQDSYFPKFLVDKGKAILMDLCSKIELEQPKDLNSLYQLTHSATKKFNDLGNEFFENGSEKC